MDTELIISEAVKKVGGFGADKFLVDHLAPEQRISLTFWATLYLEIRVKGAAPGTVKAKLQDLGKFLSFFTCEVGGDHVDAWTPAVTRAFQNYLQEIKSKHTDKHYSPETINRILSTVGHFGRWLHKQRPLLAGNPMENYKEITTDYPNWNGLTDREIMLLKSACEQRVAICTKRNQNPLLETAVFYLLYQTGLRVGELVALNPDQYHHKGFHNVKRKGKKAQRKVAVPKEARIWLDRYIDEIRGRGEGALLLSRDGERLTTKAIWLICKRLARQASTHLPEKEKISLTPHMLRHTFLKRVADKYGTHYAQEVSGNVSYKVIFRYTKPSEAQQAKMVEELFN